MKQRLCACGNPLPPRVHTCEACKLAKIRAELAADRAAREERSARPSWKAESVQVEVFQPWTPRPKPAPLMTDAEQRALDAKVDRAMYLRCGYGHGPVRKLSREEIERVKGTLTPLEQIPTPNVAPWALKGVAI